MQRLQPRFKRVQATKVAILAGEYDSAPDLVFPLACRFILYLNSYLLMNGSSNDFGYFQVIDPTMPTIWGCS
jgi:hypothetical protein